MAEAPLRTELSDTFPNPSNAVMRAGMGRLWDWLTEMLPTSGGIVDARKKLGLEIGVNVQAHDDATAKTDEVNNWTKAQRITPVAVTSTAGSVTLDLAASNNFTLTLTEDTTLADPTITAEMVGQVGAIDAANGATAYALLYSASPVWTPFDAAADLPTVSGDVNVTETFVYKVESLTVIRIMKVS